MIGYHQKDKFIKIFSKIFNDINIIHILFHYMITKKCIIICPRMYYGDPYFMRMVDYKFTINSLSPADNIIKVITKNKKYLMYSKCLNLRGDLIDNHFYIVENFTHERFRNMYKNLYHMPKYLSIRFINIILER